MRYLSLFSGIEAATVAWKPLGWDCVAVAEIEPFPCKVLAHHYPNVPNLGDITKFKEWPKLDFELLVGGSPCQSFSIAGLRAGLNDPRGNLMLTYLAVVEKYKPKFIVWENVPGVLSSNQGNDFTTFLDTLENLGYIIDCDILDAQFHGVPQRRRRVFVCAQHRDDLLNQMTDSSASTIAQCLQEILQAILVETTKVYLKEPTKLESAHLSKDGVMRRMKLFKMLGEDNNFNLLQTNLVDAFLRCHQEQNQSGVIRGELEKERTQADQLTGLKTESLFTPTEQSLKNVLAESYEVMKSFITLTGINTITPMQIYICSQAVLHIEKLIQHLSKSCPPYWNAELSSLTSLEAYTNYARQTNNDIFGDMDRFQAWSNFIEQAEHSNDFIRNTRKNGSAAAILFEQHSLQRHSSPSREKRQDVTEIAGTLAANGGGLNRPAGNANELDFCIATHEVAGTMMANKDSGGFSNSSDHAAAGYMAIQTTCSGKETFGTLMANCGTKQWLGNQEALSGDYHVFALAGNTIGRQPENGGNGNGYDASGVSYTLTKTDVHAVAFGVGEKPDLAHRLRSGASKADNHDSTTYIEVNLKVRRLTPIECARLQGFDDNYLSQVNGASDSAMYKALGNSMAVPCMAWIGKRIEEIAI